MKKLGVYLLTASLIISISIFAFAGETGLNDIKSWLTNVDTRLTAIEEKMGADFEVPQAAETYTIDNQFELSRYRLDFDSFSTTAYGEIKALHRNYSIANLKLIIYGHSGEILDTTGISFMDLKVGQPKTFDVYLSNIENSSQVAGFKVEFSSGN